jgi:schlafen family protein
MVNLKSLSLWDEDYVASLPVGEFDWLEYKASKKFADSGWSIDMSKYVSAWGNYDGGYIIFGVEDPQPGKPLVIDGGVAESAKPNLLNWLDDIIPNLVEPPLPKLSTWLIHPKGSNSRIKPGHLLVAIHIPQSESAPHQALDHKYYQRIGRKLHPLKHRAIQDITGRRQFPRLRTTIRVHTKGGARSPFVFWRLENVGPVLANHWMVIVKFPTSINGRSVGFVDEKTTIDETQDGKSFLQLRIHKLINYPPLFPQSDISASYNIGPVTYTPELKPSINHIRVMTYADSMPPFEETIALSDALRD